MSGRARILPLSAAVEECTTVSRWFIFDFVPPNPLADGWAVNDNSGRAPRLLEKNL
jgi:hypothetical protein